MGARRLARGDPVVAGQCQGRAADRQGECRRAGCPGAAGRRLLRPRAQPRPQPRRDRAGSGAGHLAAGHSEGWTVRPCRPRPLWPARRPRLHRDAGGDAGRFPHRRPRVRGVAPTCGRNDRRTPVRGAVRGAGSPAPRGWRQPAPRARRAAPRAAACSDPPAQRSRPTAATSWFPPRGRWCRRSPAPGRERSRWRGRRDRRCPQPPLWSRAMPARASPASVLRSTSPRRARAVS